MDDSEYHVLRTDISRIVDEGLRAYPEIRDELE